jgi:NAD-dependent deacetylase
VPDLFKAMDIKRLREVQERISTSKKVAVLTGAGISADSGVPTFRGEDGLWRNFRAEDLATPEAFERDPVLVWEWYNWRRELIATKHPNPAHYALAGLEKQLDAFALVTQNVDGFHAKAGSRKMIELHGNLWKVRCTKCGKVVENTEVPIQILPYCKCNGLLRPHIVWFGEVLYAPDVLKSARAFESCDLMLVIGTSGIVQPAASFVSLAKDHGAFVVEINVTESASSSNADILLVGRAAEVVPQIIGVDS